MRAEVARLERLLAPLREVAEIELQHAPSLAAVSDWKKLLASERELLAGPSQLAPELGDLCRRAAFLAALRSAVQKADLDRRDQLVAQLDRVAAVVGDLQRLVRARTERG
jgi:hypothetical protein